MPGLIQLERIQVSPADLLLDPNNPRFLDIAGWSYVDPNQYHNQSRQDQAFRLLEAMHPGEIDNLRNSIKSNGFIPSELIVVKPYPHDDTKYIVIEGNRRLTALRGIIENAVDSADPLIQSISLIEVMLYTPTGDDEQDRTNEMILQGIRHISGPKEWGAYQKANLVVQLRDGSSQQWSEIASRLGLGPRVTTRYYRAFKALGQMMADEEYRDLAHPTLFSLFDEALNKPAIKEWLTWSETDMKFTNDQRLKTFFGLLVDDPNNDRPASITNPQDMRKFSSLMASGKQNVIQRFLDGDIKIDQAQRLVEEPAPVSLTEASSSFLFTLARFPLDQVLQLQPHDMGLFDQIIAKFSTIKSAHTALADAHVTVIPEPEPTE